MEARRDPGYSSCDVFFFLPFSRMRNTRATPRAVVIGECFYPPPLKWEMFLGIGNRCDNNLQLIVDRIRRFGSYYLAEYVPVLRGGIVNRTYGTHKNLYLPIFSIIAIFGLSCYGPPYYLIVRSSL